MECEKGMNNLQGNVTEKRQIKLPKGIRILQYIAENSLVQFMITLYNIRSGNEIIKLVNIEITFYYFKMMSFL